MPHDIQHIHVVMWEPTDPGTAEPFEFRWSRSRDDADAWWTELVRDERTALTIYSATLPLPTDGDFATDDDLKHSVQCILEAWPRNQLPPLEQAVDGRAAFVGTASSVIPVS